MNRRMNRDFWILMGFMAVFVALMIIVAVIAG